MVVLSQGSIIKLKVIETEFVISFYKGASRLFTFYDNKSIRFIMNGFCWIDRVYVSFGGRGADCRILFSQNVSHLNCSLMKMWSISFRNITQTVYANTIFLTWNWNWVCACVNCFANKFINISEPRPAKQIFGSELHDDLCSYIRAYVSQMIFF